LTAVVVLAILFVIGKSAVYKIHAYERGLHLRGGRFVKLDEPGWHIQIPLVDTVLIVKVNERLGYVEQVPAMTSDDVTMDVSLQYTYRVNDPERFALEVDDPLKETLKQAKFARYTISVNTVANAHVLIYATDVMQLKIIGDFTYRIEQ
jgi:regulator of protease activity HflC (stomatin/prohibitin superfamily)